MTNFVHYRTHIGSNPERFFKSTVFEGSGLRLGTNCLEPGQSQPEHVHTDQDKFYYVVEGHGEFVIGEESRAAGPGMVVWAPAGMTHGVANRGSTRLVMLVGMAPSPTGDPLALRPSRTRRQVARTTRGRKSARRARRKAKKTVKRARKAAGRVKKRASKTGKRAKSAIGRAKKTATKTAKRAKQTAKRAREALQSGTKQAKHTVSRARKAASRTRKKAAKAAKRTKRTLSAAQKRTAKTAKQARKAVRKFKKG